MRYMIVSGRWIPGRGVVSRVGARFHRAWAGNGAQNPKNLRHQNFAKTEERRGQTRSVGAQTVSSPFFNAKFCRLRFFRVLCNAPAQARWDQARSRREVKRGVQRERVRCRLPGRPSTVEGSGVGPEGHPLIRRRGDSLGRCEVCRIKSYD